MPLVIGLTGSIASGKSTVARTMVELGAVHCDADPLVHRMYDPGKPAFPRIVAIFGEDVVGTDGFIDRRKLGAKTFGKPEEMGKLTRAIGDIGGEVHGVIDKWRAELPADGVAVMEAVNLIEAGYSGWCECTWLVTTDRQKAIDRVMARNQFSIEESTQRVDGQRPWELRAPASDHIYHNDGTLEELVEEVRRVYKETYDLWKAGRLPQRKFDAWNEQRLAQLTPEQRAAMQGRRS
ncbi:MAG TPA: dephospho-CoA kinase [Dehalococcoidia bacterium]